MEKYRIQRRAVGPAYSAEAMKDLEPSIDFIMEKNIEIMRKRAGKPIDIDLSATCLCWVGFVAADCVPIVNGIRLRGNGNVLQAERLGRGWR